MEQQLVALAKRLRQERIPTTMVFARPPAAFPGDALREAGVRLRHLDFARPPYRLARELWSWMRVERPRIAHFHFIDPYSPLVVAAGLAGARVLIHDHLALSRGDPLRAAWKGLRSLLLNGLFDERVAVSSFVARTIREVHRVPAARVSMVGEGPRLGDWRALCASLGISSRVHFLGLRLDVEEILAAASVVVAPSVA